jgi:diguanylate cyclase (GGDEF)-like protein/PAS domain S-box-containing protein
MQEKFVIGRIASTRFLTCGPDTPVRAAAERMSASRYSSILVVDAGKVAGIWTERDALSVPLDNPVVLERPIRLVMSAPVITAAAETTIEEAAARLKQTGIRHLVVTDANGNPCGLISQTDLVSHQGAEAYLRLLGIADIMRPVPPILHDAMTVADAAARMRQQNWDAVVVASDRSDKGIFTERDVVRLIGLGDTRLTLSAAATYPLITIPQESTVLDARRVFATQQIRHLGVQDAEGRISGLLSYSDLLAAVESAQLKHIQETLREQVQRAFGCEHFSILMGKVFETAREGIVVCDSSGIIRSVNPAFCRITGYSPDEAIGRNPRILKSGRHDNDFYRQMWGTLAQQGQWSGELWNRRRSGEIYLQKLSLIAIRNGQSEVTHYVGISYDATEERRTQEALRTSESRLELFFAQSLDGFFMMETEDPVAWDPACPSEETLERLAQGLRITKANAAFLAQYKARPEQYVERSFSAFFGHDPAYGRQILKELLDRGHMRMETDERRTDGSNMWIEGDYIVFHDSEGRVSGAFGIQRDITERRRSEEALHASEERYRLLVEHSPDGILIHHNGIVEFANPAAAAILGGRVGELIGRNILDFVHPDSRETVVSRQRELQSTRSVPVVEERLLRLDDSPIHAEVGASSFVAGNRRLVQVIFRDIAARRQAETALRESEERLSLVIRGTSDGIWDWDIEKDYVYYSPRFRELLGYESEVEFRQNFLFRDSLHPDDRDRTVAAVNRALAGGPAFNEEYRLKRRDGSFGWFRGRGLALRNAGTKAYRFAGSLTDINGIKQSELLLAAERRIFEHLASGTELPQILDMLCRDLESILPVTSRVSLQLLEDNRLRHGAAPGIPKKFWERLDNVPPGPQSGSSSQAAYTKTRIISADIGIDPAWRDLREAAFAHEFHACWSTPVIATAGEVLGTLTVYHNRPRVPDLREMQTVDRFIHLARMLIEDRRTQANLQLASSVIEHGSEGVMITDAQSKILRVNEAFCRITGYSEAEVVGLSPSVLNSGRHDAAFYQKMWQTLEKTGQWRGEIWNRRKNGEVYPEWLTISAIRNDQGRVTHFAALFSDVTEQKATEERIHRLAFYDALTGLPNRPMLEDHLRLALSAARRQQKTVALMFLDIDHFKQINDSMGHAAGDLLLKETAQRILSCVREGDTVSRMGGDEFVILLPDCGELSQAISPGAISVAEKIQKTLAQPVQLAGHEVSVTVSIGIALYPSDALNGSDLVKHADIAMYHAKSQGRDNFQFYTVQMNEALMERLSLERAMKKAIEENQFRLYYQPRIDVKSGRIVGLEALIRWQHQELGSISPARFIPLAEETGHILPIGEWVLRTACQQCQEWIGSGLWKGMGTMAVNVSPRQFQQAGFVDVVHDALAESGLTPERLEIEVTEGTLIHGSAPEATLISLRELGVQVAIDDFGTGYSSLSYLKRFPLDVLKIDQSFIRDLSDNPNDAAITLAIISMAKNLQLRVVAEGVETPEQYAFLKSNGCDECQGYLFSKPQPVESIAQILANQIESSASRAA